MTVQLGHPKMDPGLHPARRKKEEEEEVAMEGHKGSSAPCAAHWMA